MLAFMLLYIEFFFLAQKSSNCVLACFSFNYLQKNCFLSNDCFNCYSIFIAWNLLVLIMIDLIMYKENNWLWIFNVKTMLEDESFGSAMCTIDFEKKVPNNIYIDIDFST
jgi:hypothetical protein